MPFECKEVNNKVNIGDYILPKEYVKKLDDFEEINLDEEMIAKINEACNEDYPKFELKIIALEPNS